MSEPLRIGLVAEGITDYEVLHAVVGFLLGGRSFEFKLLQPEGSVAFSGGGQAGRLGGGWRGVHRWCRQSAERGAGRLSEDPVFDSYDLLILHLDADVAGEDPGRSPVSLRDVPDGLPCEQGCPPPEATTNRLRAVLLGWAGEDEVPSRTVLCIPSKSMETWVMAVFFVDDGEMERRGWECHPNPAGRLSVQPAHVRFAKSQAEYRARGPRIQERWPAVVERLSEASRFDRDMRAAIGDIAG